jgi:hypothetical protein
MNQILPADVRVPRTGSVDQYVTETLLALARAGSLFVFRVQMPEVEVKRHYQPRRIPRSGYAPRSSRVCWIAVVLVIAGLGLLA